MPEHDVRDQMDYHDSLLDLIGGTPLVRLNRVVAGIPAMVLAKVEYFNPGGSVKDRIALRMVQAAERDGRLGAGGTIVEPTSGNTGVGLAIVAQQKGYRCVFSCPDKVSSDKISVLRAYGAEVVVCPAAVPVDHPDFYRNVARRLADEIPGAVRLDQYSNQQNPMSHYLTTGPEIWRQTAGRVTHFVAGVGTGGTICGAGRYLKEVSGGTVRVIGADPDGSIYSGGQGRPYLVEGVGQPFFPQSYDPAVPDEIISVSDRDAIVMTRRLAREEALLTGGSCGMAAVAALDLAARLDSEAVVVVLLPDSGRGYLSKIFDDNWVARLGLYDPPTEQPRLRDLLHVGVGSASPVLVGPDEMLATVVKTMRASGTMHAVVTPAVAPVRLAEVLGAVHEEELEAALASGAVRLEDTVRSTMSPPPPYLGAGQSVAELTSVLDDHNAVLVLDGGLVCGLVDAAQARTYLAAHHPNTP